jgi:hypothetical protein
MRRLVLCSVLIMLACVVATAHATVIYFDDFSGPDQPRVPLHGQAPTILRGYGTMLPPGSPYALKPEETSELPGLGGDIEAARAEARQLLEEADYANKYAETTDLAIFTRQGRVPHDVEGHGVYGRLLEHHRSQGPCRGSGVVRVFRPLPGL